MTTEQNRDGRAVGPTPEQSTVQGRNGTGSAGELTQPGAYDQLAGQAVCAECGRKFRRVYFVGVGFGPDTCAACLAGAPAPVKISRACQGALGCILENEHMGPHTFDLGESARLGLGRESLAELATKTGRQLEEAADVLRQIGNAVAAGLGAWTGEADELPEPARLRAFLADARDILIEDGAWIGELSGADVIEALTQALVTHGFGPKGGR